MSTVLVIDDDPIMSALVHDALEDEGYCVLEAAAGAAALIAHAEQPDAILLDVMMPGMDGVEVSKRLHADPATATIPIIVMSASATERTIAEMAAADCLPKPFELDQLYDTVGRWAH